MPKLPQSWEESYDFSDKLMFNLRITEVFTLKFYQNDIFDPSLKKINGLDFPTFH